MGTNSSPPPTARESIVTPSTTTSSPWTVPSTAVAISVAVNRTVRVLQLVLMANVRLVVLFGGRSAEHEVSCISARHVLEAADRSRYDVTPIGITREGRWLDAAGALEALSAGAAALPSPDDSDGAELDPLPAILPAGQD